MLTQDVVIAGAGVGVTGIVGLGTSDVVSVTGGAVTLTDLTIDGNLLNRGIDVEDTAGLFTLENAEVIDTDTPSGGSGLRVTGADAILTNVVFDGCSSTLGGGAVSLASTATFDGIGVDFANCSSLADGGAVSVVAGDFACDGCTFTTTNAATTGGAVYASLSTVTLVASSFDGTTAGSNGGAIALDNSLSTSLVDLDAVGGGAIVGGFLHATAPQTPVDVQRVQVCNHTAVGAGAIFVSGDLDLSNSVFVDNGGSSAVEVTGGHLAALNNHFLSNDGTNALSSTNGTFDVRNNLFAHNAIALNNALSSGTNDYNAFFANAQDHASLTPGANSQFAQDPMLQVWSDDGDCTNDVLYPLYVSPLVEAGDPAVSDPDGTTSDIGAFGGPGADPDAWANDDGDPRPLLFDCDETQGTVFQGNYELCSDGLDNDCDGVIDDPSAIDAVVWFVDLDGDGWGDNDDFGILTCDQPADTVNNSWDCDDTDPMVNPDQDELCSDNGADTNCDGDTEYGALDATDYFVDLDGDGYGDDATLVRACNDPGGVVTQGGDCDDADPYLNPGMTDDTCDGVDDNCSGDESDTPGWVEYWEDADGDGYGYEYEPGAGCTQPPDTATNPDDCYDLDATINPGMSEICDALDNDCNGVVDDGPQASWFEDRDGDGFGDSSRETIAFCAPPGWAAESGDCDDHDPAAYPTADEVCDGIDNDCDGDVDVDDSSLTDGITGWKDHDGDGFGFGEPYESCDEDLAMVGGDCADLSPAINPDAREIPGNDVDEDCDGEAQGSDRGSGDPKTVGCACSSVAPGPSPVWLFAALLLLRRKEG